MDQTDRWMVGWVGYMDDWLVDKQNVKKCTSM